jgi:hypothetical protein
MARPALQVNSGSISYLFAEAEAAVFLFLSFLPPSGSAPTPADVVQVSVSVGAELPSSSSDSRGGVLRQRPCARSKSIPPLLCTNRDEPSHLIQP